MSGLVKEERAREFVQHNHGKEFAAGGRRGCAHDLADDPALPMQNLARNGRGASRREAQHAALYPTEVLHPGDNLLARVATLCKADPVEEVQINHLRDKLAGSCPDNRWDTRLNVCQLPQCPWARGGVDRVTIRRTCQEQVPLVVAQDPHELSWGGYARPAQEAEDSSVNQRCCGLRPQEVHSCPLQGSLSDICWHQQGQSILPASRRAEEMSRKQQAPLGICPAGHHSGVGPRAGHILGQLALQKTVAIGSTDGEDAEIIQNNAA